MICSFKQGQGTRKDNSMMSAEKEKREATEGPQTGTIQKSTKHVYYRILEVYHFIVNQYHTPPKLQGKKDVS